MKRTINLRPRPLWRLAHTLVLLLCLSAVLPAWADDESSGTSGAEIFTFSSTVDSGKKYRIRCVYDWQSQSTLFLYDNGGTVKGQAYATGDNAQQQLWTITPVDDATTASGSYYVQNASTGKYLVSVNSNNEVATTSDTKTAVYLSYSESYGNWNILSSSTSTTSYNYQGGDIKGWSAHNGTSEEQTNSEWFLITTTTLPSTQPVRLVNNQYTTKAIAEAADGGVTSVTYADNADDLSQLWYVEPKAGTDSVSLRNAWTGHYIQQGTHNNLVTTGSSPSGHVFSVYSTINTLKTESGIAYNVLQKSGESLNQTDKRAGVTNAGGSTSAGDVYIWDGSDSNSAWLIQPVTLTTEQQTTLAAFQQSRSAMPTTIATQKLRIKTARTNDYNIADNSGTAALAAASTTDESQTWIAEKQTNGSYALRNYKTGKYLGYGTTTDKAKKTWFFNAVFGYTASVARVVIGETNSATSGNALRYDADSDVTAQGTATDGTDAEWILEAANVDDADVRSRYGQWDGTLAAVPTDGSYVKIYNVGNDAQVLSSTASGTLTAATAAEKSVAQLWKVTATGTDSHFTLQNALTGEYIAIPEATKNTEVTTSATAPTDGFNFVPLYTDYTQMGEYYRFHPAFNIALPTDQTLALHASSGKVIVWGPYAAASHWTLRAADLTADEIASLGTQDKAQAAAGQAKPLASTTQVYRIVNNQYATNAIAENDNNGVTTLNYTLAANETDYSQYWYAETAENGGLAFRNALTGHYIQSNPTNNSQYQTGSTAYGFTVEANSHVTDTYKYNITDGTLGYGFNATDKDKGTTNVGGSSNTGDVYSYAAYDGSQNPNSLWVFYAVPMTTELSSAIEEASAAYEKQKALYTTLTNGKLRIKTARANGYYITDDNSRASLATLDETNEAQMWIAEQSGEGYTFRNYKTGNYLQAASSTSTSSKTFYIRLWPSNTEDQSYVNISEKSDYSGNGVHYQTNGNVVVSWSVNAGEGSNWTFEALDNITDDAVRTRYDSFDGAISSIADGTIFKAKNAMHGTVLEEEVSSGAMSHLTSRSKAALQLWKAEAVEDSDGYFQLKNVLTDNYIKNTTGWNARVYVQSTAPDGGFLVKDVSTRFHSRFAFVEPSNSTYALHAQNTGALVIWTPQDAEASYWTLQTADMTDTEIEAQRTTVAEVNTEIKAAATDYTALTTFFNDALCTDLKTEYASLTDDDFTTKLTEAGVTSPTLRTEALKVKNNTWAKWEKTFRVRKAHPYANPDTWENILKIGNRYTNLTNPTGIWGTPYETQYVYVGSDIPEGASLAIKSSPAASNQGTTVCTLKKGLNAFQVSTEGQYYIDYVVPTDASETSKKLADFADLDIRIEGGEVDGYFDATIDEIGTNDFYKEMIADGMFQKSYIALKGQRYTIQYFTDWAKEIFNKTGHVRELVDFWDWMLTLFHKEMGINDYYDRWNCLDGFYNVSSGLYATTYGIYYADKNIMNYDDLISGNGDLWGPAHETGHNHQKLINIIGTTEISNNMFSEVIVHSNGVQSTRQEGQNVDRLAEAYAAKTGWHDINSWQRTQMYAKLYFYYEVAGKHPNFLRELFTALRNDPCEKGTDENNPTPASKDFLKFALTVCKVVNEDLSEFFDAYGFFVPFEKRCIGDYANYWTYCTQEMIDEAKKEMQSYSTKNTNIIFIENHVKNEPRQDHDGNILYEDNGEVMLRKDYGGSDCVGQCGDVGSYSDYTSATTATGYTALMNGNTISMTAGTGAVGYKVYDAEGNLLYFSNSNQFTLPESVVTALNGATPVIKVAGGDGVEQTAEVSTADNVYHLKLYSYADRASKYVKNYYTDGTQTTLPTLAANQLAFVQNDDAPASMTGRDNYVVVSSTNARAANSATSYSAEKLVLTDKVDFYTPYALTAANVVYTRTNTAGYNSVCLPFAISSADFGTGAKVEQFTSLTTENGATELNFTETTDELAAGTPCLVWCPDDSEGWTIEKTDAEIVTDPVDVTNGGFTMKGSFINQKIGANKYKLNAAGSHFGVTTANGKVTAYRSYLEAAASAAAREFTVNHLFAGDDNVTSLTEANAASRTEKVYDLSGREVKRPLRQGMYIIGGRKVLVK